jgi:hypothetical protein
MTLEVLPDVNDFQEDDFTGVIFNDDDGTVRFQDPERPDPEEVLDRFNGMSYHLEQENDRRNSIVYYLESEGIMRPNFASQNSRAI